MNSDLLKMLLIEDNPGDARLIEEMLKEAGLQFNLECSGSLSAGIGLIRSHSFDLILLDLGLPDSQGLGTLSKLNESGRSAPVIVLTGLSDDAAGIEAVKEGAQDYLIKGQINNILLARSIKYAVERNKVELTLRESEERYRYLITNMVSGFAFHKIITNDKNIPIDYEFIEMNDAFEQMTGLKREQIIGKKVKEALPGIEKDPTDWIGKYGNVTLTGKELKMEIHSFTSKKWYHICAYSPTRGYFAVIFDDITQRKQAEEELNKYRDHLEELVKERTAQVDQKNEELERFNKLFVGRELRMIELKKKIADLEKEIGDMKKATGAK